MLYHRKTRSKKVQMQARAVAVWGQHRALPFSSAQETVGPKKREASENAKASMNFWGKIE